ncbi:MAG: hypothetical protein RL380_604 [Verrucomicrobiota bacterium]
MHFPTRLKIFLLLAATAFLPRAHADAPATTVRPSPAWIRDAVVYEIFVRNFSSAGNFPAVTARLDELKNLGVDVLWLMPIHPVGEKLRKGTVGSPYAIRDYYAIDPANGTPAEFKQLIAAAHARGLKVIMDLVANHTAWDSVMMAHPEFYKQDAHGKIIPPVEGWTDVAGLNYTNAQLRDYMITMMRHWLVDFDVDGFRCDVAYMVPTDFWEQARAALEKSKPGFLLLAEASKPELLTQAFDLDYAWPLHGTLNQVMIEGAPASELQKSWENSRREFPAGALHLRISDNHDEARAVARFGLRGALATQVFMLTLDGVPLFYNGMEVGDAAESGDPALFEKLPIFWNPKERPPLRAIYRDLLKLRKTHPAFRTDSVTWLKNSAPENVLTFTRDDDHEEFLIVINLSSRPQATTVELTAPEKFSPVKINGQQPPGLDTTTLKLGGYEWRIYHRTR